MEFLICVGQDAESLEFALYEVAVFVFKIDNVIYPLSDHSIGGECGCLASRQVRPIPWVGAHAETLPQQGRFTPLPRSRRAPASAGSRTKLRPLSGSADGDSAF